MSNNSTGQSRTFSNSIDEFPIIIDKNPLISDEHGHDYFEEGTNSINLSILSHSTSFSSFDSFTTSSHDDLSTDSTILSRVESDSGLSEKTFMVHLTKEEQIERDSTTEEQLTRIRKEIEMMGREREIEKEPVKDAGVEAQRDVQKKRDMQPKGDLQSHSQTNTQTNSQTQTSLKRRKSRKDLVKVPLEDGLPVALHPQETGKEEEENDSVDEDDSRDQGQDSSQFGGVKIVNEDHRNYILMYDMLTGIRTSVSRCQAKPSRPLTSKDFHSTHKMAFDLTGSEETPSSRYDFKFKDYSPWVFRSLREQFLIDAADYLVSLTGKYVLSELYSPGKSGSLFYYSQDYRFIIKTIRESEHLFLRKILPHYHKHIQRNVDTLLVRFYGLHRVQLPMGKKIYFVVMGNLFPNTRAMRSIYDLKGSTHGRWNSEEFKDDPIDNRKGPGPVVLKDLNWLKRNEKLVLGSIKATKLMNQLKIDCIFLAKLKIMDYSLLIGLHTLPKTPEDPVDLNLRRFSGNFMFYKDFNGYQSSFKDNSNGPEVYYLGIIDILTPYSMTKKLEHTFKSLVFPKDSISAVNPTDYARRFLKFMSDNILSDVSADYSNKSLPLVPEVHEGEVYQEGGGDGFICVESDEEV